MEAAFWTHNPQLAENSFETGSGQCISMSIKTIPKQILQDSGHLFFLRRNLKKKLEWQGVNCYYSWYQTVDTISLFNYPFCIPFSLNYHLGLAQWLTPVVQESLTHEKPEAFIALFFLGRFSFTCTFIVTTEGESTKRHQTGSTGTLTCSSLLIIEHLYLSPLT